MNKFLARKIKKVAVFFLIIFLIMSLFLNFKFKPVAQCMAKNKAKMIVSDIINTAVIDDMNCHKENYIGLVNIEKNDKNGVTAIYSDVCKINSLKSYISIFIQKKFSEFKEKTFWISSGTLSGVEMINGKGPKIPMSIAASGNVFTDFKSDFLSAGINQTLHRISVSIASKISVVLPGCSCAEEVKTDVLVAETVVVGDVPKVFAGSNNCDVCKLTDIEKK